MTTTLTQITSKQKRNNQTMTCGPKRLDDEYERFVLEGTIASYEENKYKALSCFNQAIQLCPKLYLPYLKRGIEFFNLSSKSRAIDDFKKVLECLTKYPEEQPFYGNEQHEKQLLLIVHGLILEVNGEIDKSKTYYEQACALHRYKPETLQIMELEIDMACKENDKSEIDEDLLDEEVVNDDTHREEREKLRAKKIDLEIQRIQEYEHDTYTSYAFFSLGFIQCSLRQYEEAIVSYRKSIAFGPMHNDCIHYNNLGFCFENIGKKDEAFKCYQKSFNSYNRCLKSMFNICKMLYQDYKKYDEAMEMLKTIEAIDPSQQDIWVERGEIYLSQAKSKEAEDCLMKAIRRDPSSSYAYLRLASAHIYRIISQATNANDLNMCFASIQSVISDILEKGKNNMIDDKEVAKFYVFEKVISDSLAINEDTEIDNKEDMDAIEVLNQRNINVFLKNKRIIFPPETRFNREFKVALLYNIDPCLINNYNASPSSPANSPNRDYEYYFEKYSGIQQHFIDVEIYFQSDE
jgi:tetratricopeptide (TPR) repeat protein